MKESKKESLRHQAEFIEKFQTFAYPDGPRASTGKYTYLFHDTSVGGTEGGGTQLSRYADGRWTQGWRDQEEEAVADICAYVASHWRDIRAGILATDFSDR